MDKDSAVASGIKNFKPKRYSLCDISKSEIYDFKHAHLDYVSGKGAVFRNFDFSYSVMTDCYFHKANFVDCKFIGARFFRCNFRGAEFERCNFMYIDANETRISANQVLNNMPDFPNIGREIAQVMRRNATSLGDVRASRKFMLYELEQRKEHIRRALRGEGQYYKRKYNTLSVKFRLLLEIILLRADSFIWGHGEKVWKLFASAAILVVLLSVCAFLIWLEGNRHVALDRAWQVFLSILKYYLSFFLSVESQPPVPRLLPIEWLLAIARLIVVGMLVSALFRWLSHR